MRWTHIVPGVTLKILATLHADTGFSREIRRWGRAIQTRRVLRAGLTGATAGALIAVGLSMTILAGPFFAYCERAADEVLDPGQYISAVMGK